MMSIFYFLNLILLIKINLSVNGVPVEPSQKPKGEFLEVNLKDLKIDDFTIQEMKEEFETNVKGFKLAPRSKLIHSISIDNTPIWIKSNSNLLSFYVYIKDNGDLLLTINKEKDENEDDLVEEVLVTKDKVEYLGLLNFLHFLNLSVPKVGDSQNKTGSSDGGISEGTQEKAQGQEERKVVLDIEDEFDRKYFRHFVRRFDVFSYERFEPITSEELIQKIELNNQILLDLEDFSLGTENEAYEGVSEESKPSSEEPKVPQTEVPLNAPETSLKGPEGVPEGEPTDPKGESPPKGGVFGELHSSEGEDSLKEQNPQNDPAQAVDHSPENEEPLTEHLPENNKEPPKHEPQNDQPEQKEPPKDDQPEKKEDKETQPEDKEEPEKKEENKKLGKVLKDNEDVEEFFSMLIPGGSGSEGEVQEGEVSSAEESNGAKTAKISIANRDIEGEGHEAIRTGDLVRTEGGEVKVEERREDLERGIRKVEGRKLRILSDEEFEKEFESLGLANYEGLVAQIQNAATDAMVRPTVTDLKGEFVDVNEDKFNKFVYNFEGLKVITTPIALHPKKSQQTPKEGTDTAQKDEINKSNQVKVVKKVTDNQSLVCNINSGDFIINQIKTQDNQFFIEFITFSRGSRKSTDAEGKEKDEIFRVNHLNFKKLNGKWVKISQVDFMESMSLQLAISNSLKTQTENDPKMGQKLIYFRGFGADKNLPFVKELPEEFSQVVPSLNPKNSHLSHTTETPKEDPKQKEQTESPKETDENKEKSKVEPEPKPTPTETQSTEESKSESEQEGDQSDDESNEESEDTKEHKGENEIKKTENGKKLRKNEESNFFNNKIQVLLLILTMKFLFI